MAIRIHQKRVPRSVFLLVPFALLVAVVAYNWTYTQQNTAKPASKLRPARDGGTSAAAAAAADRKQQASEKPEDSGKRLPDTHVADPDPVIVKQRCGATLGDWCGRYDAQQPIPARPPPRGNKACLWGEPAPCNFVGVCDAMMGWCRCPAGWAGDDCSTRMKRPCSQHFHPHGFEPYNQPVNLSSAGSTLACADLCDEDYAICYCNSTFAFGRIPADPGQPPGTPPRRIGRPIGHNCRRNKDTAGASTPFGSVDPELLYGPDGWCQAAKPQRPCPCYVDGLDGEFCDVVNEAYCPNQCNGHGECRLGFCYCHKGWFGHDCAYRTADTPWTPGLEETDRPWLKQLVHTPAAHDPEPGAIRKRPLIYVYELPPLYNALMLSYRTQKGHCVVRYFDANNDTILNDPHLHNLETGLHEMFLQSEHRTLDPEEADFFYVPVYTRCLIYPILNAADHPWFHGGPAANRVGSAANMLLEAQRWLGSHLPYWDRNGGRDHIVLSVHDEGSCWIPAVLRPAIIISHWGRTDLPHTSLTSFFPDNYSVEIKHKTWQPEGQLSKLGNHACYDPNKDLTVPLMWSPNKYKDSPMLGAPTRERHILAFFKGRMMQGNPAYSRGTRQFLDNMTREHDWWSKHRIHVGEHMPEGETGSYSATLASSIFCFSLMGEGWGSRFDEAVLHGCIPVLIHDGVEPSWNSILDVASYSVRIAEKDMARVPDILGDVSQEEVTRMQANLAKVWRRHIWTAYRPYRELARQLLQERRNATAAAPLLSQPPPELDYDPATDDAFSTLIQWLYSRLDHSQGGL